MNRKVISTIFEDIKTIKSILKKNGIDRFFEKAYDSLIVQESDTVQIKIHLRSNGTMIESLFPQIGNPIQVIATIILIILFYYISLPFPIILAILGGQLISFGLYYPKIKTLRTKVEKALIFSSRDKSI